MEDIGGEDEGGWGDNDLKLDDEDDMGDELKDDDADSNAKGDGWAAEDDIEISQDMEATPVKEDPGEGQNDRYFVAPVGGGRPALRQSDYEVTFFLSLSIYRYHP